ncbi:MAG TPA: protein kinase [Candidatus Acidoferrum sp.]|jgi:serine/threonine protein kinase|nr:protein kinase [Candidatus Acidoferrum sp.]
MTQPTDPRASNGADRPASPSDASRSPRPRQDTVLLSDVPDADTLFLPSNEAPPAVEETRASNRGTNSGASPTTASLHSAHATNLNLSSAALSALGQRYNIVAEAGHGSMGNVYKALDRETGETVALKLLKPEIASDQQMMDRFKNELLFARKITHKNVCRVHEFNRIGGISYTSMEFVEGESLRSVLNRFGGLPLRKGIDITQQICSGLKEAHAQGIVHRDLKPENVMIDARGNVKIMDFGIARSMESLTRMTGAMVGTPAYMAPEQVSGKAVDYRTDIYSLGLILYEIFTGQQAFTADNAVAVAMKQLQEAPTPPHEVEPSIPVGIERAILRCLEKAPEKRFQSVAELEKFFASPSATGAPFAAGSTTAGRSTQDAFAMQRASGAPVTAAQPIHLAPPPPKRSAKKWLALATVVGLALVLVANAGRLAQQAQIADKLPPPPAPAAPSVPDLAMLQDSRSSAGDIRVDSKAEATPVATASDSSTPTTEPADQTPAGSAAANLAGTSSAPASATTTQPANTAAPAAAKPAAAPGSAPADVQQRADSAFKESAPATSNQTATNASQNAAPQMGSVLRGGGPSYIWVARFDREDRAQDASRRIQGLGLPSVVVPRRELGGKQAYVVFTGPVAPARIPSEIDWLKTQGFPNVREVKGLGLGQANIPGSSTDSQSNAGGATQ